MSNKLIKNLSLIFVMLIAFFGFTNNVLAAEKVRTRAIYPKPYNNVYFTLRLIDDGKTGTHTLNTGIYTINGKHAYCIEPGVEINGTSGYSTGNGNSLSSYTGGYFTKDTGSWQFVANDTGTDNDRRKLISYILTFAQNEGNIAEGTYNSSNW